ncbi:hypothetical protein [Roseivirga thermotolerans]|uniref:hypothetical protein n=1 Tax=Roseivirga thermotolerans TaxID=1758176 RepID=UPI0016795CDB|nr:hypothetical protein [Roseivirga thermotolerans]
MKAFRHTRLYLDEMEVFEEMANWPPMPQLENLTVAQYLERHTTNQPFAFCTVLDSEVICLFKTIVNEDLTHSRLMLSITNKKHASEPLGFWAAFNNDPAYPLIEKHILSELHGMV